MAAAKPNLFVIGAAKSGTTTLHHYLGQHPDIWMCEPKEPAFFVPEHKGYPKDPDWYHALFEPGAHLPYRGESSTDYTKRPTFEGVPRRVHAYQADARLIYIMRDPIDRAISHYWQRARQHVEARALRTAIEEHAGYRASGDYAMQIEPWMRLFGPERILLLVFEDFVEDPGGTVDRVVRWLGLPPFDVPLREEVHNRRPEEVSRDAGPEVLRRLRYSRTWHRLAPLVPQGIKDLARSTVETTERPEDVETDEIVEMLRPWARARIAELSRVTGMDFPRWTTSLGEG